MSQVVPDPVKSRFSTFPNFAYGANFPPDLPADSSIREMYLPGCWVFYREEIEALNQGFFREHDEYPSYDFAFFEDDASS